MLDFIILVQIVLTVIICSIKNLQTKKILTNIVITLFVISLFISVSNTLRILDHVSATIINSTINDGYSHFNEASINISNAQIDAHQLLIGIWMISEPIILICLVISLIAVYKSKKKLINTYSKT